VWEYINPVTSSGTVRAIGDSLPMTNAVPRAHRYSPEYPGLAGHDLNPGGLIELHLPGDLNCDGVISYADINPFVLLLSNQSQWQTQHAGCPWQNGDCNNDGVVSYADINPFVALLSGG
jgi:hypothetical protein